MRSHTPPGPLSESPPAHLTITEVAALLRVAPETIRRHVHDGTIRSVKFGRIVRIPASELDRLLDDVTASRR